MFFYLRERKKGTNGFFDWKERIKKKERKRV